MSKFRHLRVRVRTLRVAMMKRREALALLDALLGPGVNPLEGSPNVKLRKLGTEGHAPGFQL
jgi:hypothetical protein